MAFKMNWVNGDYGSGAALNVTAESILNEYAKVTLLSEKNVTVGDISNANAFQIGTEIMIHISGATDDSAKKYLGLWRMCKITAIEGNVLTCNKTVGDMQHDSTVVQVVTVPRYSTVTLNKNGVVTCPQFNLAKGYGGIVVFKANEINMNGGHINLAGKGLPDNSIRPLLEQEKNHWNGRQTFSAYENYMTYKHFTLNCPDGAAFLIAQKISGNNASRIGNPNQTGIQRSRGDDVVPTNPTHSLLFGGSSIMIVAKTFSDFSCDMLAKYASVPDKSDGGLCRCYIATDSILPNDEGLYAHDIISDSARMSRVFNIKSFGDGSDGARTDYTAQLNNYAQVTAIDSTKKVFTIANRTDDGLAKFKVGAYCIVHVVHKNYMELTGRFMLAKIIGYSLNKITLDTAFNVKANTKDYEIQLITLPQFTDFTLAKENAATPKYENGRGGILALMCTGTCDISGGKLNVEGKGGVAYGEEGLNVISNAQMSERLPLGEGNGSVLLIVQKLIMNSATRIGAKYTGNAFGQGAAYQYGTFGYGYSGSDQTQSLKVLGSGKKGGYNYAAKKRDVNGGYGSNGKPEVDDVKYASNQGAHILIIADKITGLNLAALSTGGRGGVYHSFENNVYTFATGKNGGCGYGGGGGVLTPINGGGSAGYSGYSGGWHGGAAGGYVDYTNYTSGGGSGGFAFIYCNESDSQDNSNMTID